MAEVAGELLIGGNDLREGANEQASDALPIASGPCRAERDRPASRPAHEQTARQTYWSSLAALPQQLELQDDEFGVCLAAVRTAVDAVGFDAGLILMAADESPGLWLIHRGSEQAERVAVEPDQLETNKSALVCACRAGEPVVVSTAANDAMRDEALRQLGLCTVAAFPVPGMSAVLAVASRDARLVSDQQLVFLGAVAAMAGTAIGRLNWQQQWSERAAELGKTVEVVPALVLTLSGDGRIVRANRACRLVTGFTPQELEGRYLASALLIPEDMPLVRNAIERVRQQGQVERLESFILTKAGARRRVAWSIAPLKSATADPMLVATGVQIPLLNHTLQPTQLPEGVTRDRRSTPRHQFPYYQTVAPLRDGRTPGPGDFFEVRCRDISPQGFSFLVPRPPWHSQFVVALGREPDQIFLTAVVTHITPCQIDDRNMYVVGCRYTGRLTNPEAAGEL